MQISKSRTSEELSRLWEDQESRFKRPQETLHGEELCSSVLMQIGEIGSQEGAAMRLGHMQICTICA